MGGQEEIKFEKNLYFYPFEGFTMHMLEKKVIKDKGENVLSWHLNRDNVNIFVNAMDSWLGGNKLLERGHSDSVNLGSDAIFVQSFRGDRRVVRLIIARYWAEKIISNWNAMNKSSICI